METFVDTSAWYALGVPEDSSHSAARRILKRLEEEGAILHTNEPVFSETMALMRRRVSPRAAAEMGAWILRHAAVRLHFLDSDLFQEAWRRFEGQNGKVSFVDCTAFATMEFLGLRHAFAFDEDYAAAGFRVEP